MRRKKKKGIRTASGRCRYGKVKVGPRRGQCRKQKAARR